MKHVASKQTKAAEARRKKKLTERVRSGQYHPAADRVALSILRCHLATALHRDGNLSR